MNTTKRAKGRKGVLFCQEGGAVAQWVEENHVNTTKRVKGKKKRLFFFGGWGGFKKNTNLNNKTLPS